MNDNPILFDHEAERAIMAAVMTAEEALVRVRPILNPQDFYSESHRSIYQACLRLQDQGIGRDVLTVGSELKKANCLEQAGGHSGLAELAGEFVSTSNLIHHADIVKKFSRRRTLVKAAHALYMQSHEHPDPEALVAEFHAKMLQGLGAERGQFLDMPTATNRFLDVLDQRRSGEVLNGWPTGLQALDQRIGGWKPGALNIIAARPGMGKTSLACLSVLEAAKHGARVAIFSLEMGAEELIQRFVSLSHDSLPMKALTQANLTERGWCELVATVEGLQAYTIKICDTTSLTLEKIRSMASLLKMKNGLDLLVLDYLQLLNLDERGTSRQEAMAKASRSLKVLAKDLGISVLALSQLNRQCESREDKRPHLSDLRESGALEQDSDLAIMLYRDEQYHDDSPFKGQCEILIRKNRNGPTGEFLVDWIGTHAALRDSVDGVILESWA